ncbi:MAG TPA: AAA family ATPase [Mycobacteriales bacterium]|nr:AAA family ATPase [Mycobacteriales bacterium]
MSVTETPTGILTFLIADVRGYTAFTQARGDEAAARLADKFAEVMREGVDAHGGEVTELRGDEALAVFSSPRAAVRAAIDLQMVFVDETALDPALPLTVGMGIDAGEAVPVQGGYRGGALNLAARLCSKALPGEVLVSQGIAHLTRTVEGIEFIDAGEAEVKGLAAPVPVFRARADRPPLVAPAGAGELPSALAAVTPVVGRDVEVRRLRWSWRLARRGVPTTCVVLGPPGIGKTRLVAELAAAASLGGGDVRYATFATGAPDVAELLGLPAERPALVVLDDLETATPRQVASLADTVALALTGARMLVLVVEDESASTEVLTTARRLAGDDRHVVRPRPLTLDEMVRVAGFYVGAAADVVPHDVLATTGGIPRLVHERVSEWAQGYAARRLGDLATAAASGRSDLRTVESDLAGTVIDLQQVREQATLFGLGPGRRAPDPTDSPYRGLASFDVEDGDVFFGRERLVAELISRLAGANLLGVIGASGSGKSSALRAGLLPALESGVLPGSEHWTVALLRPGEHPMRALDRALWSTLPEAVTEQLGDGEPDLGRIRTLLPDGSRLIVVVDQFEEAFTLCQDESERARFLAALSDAGGSTAMGVAVVVAVRADYYGRVAIDSGLAALIAGNHVLVGPMTAEEYRRAIVQPALRVGAVVEPELVDDLVAEVLGEPGALPLLSTALLELWEHRDGRTLRRASYVDTGGVHGAVARLADDVYESFDENQQRIVRAVMLRLAGPGLGDAVVRRRVSLSEFDVDRDHEVRRVLDVLAARRLVTMSDGTAEVAHEALLREWPRLQAWLEEDREGRRLRAHLAAAAQEWVANAKDEGELYRGARLSAALDWTTHHTSELNEVEREFITASREQTQATLHRQQRQNRRLRGLLVGVVGVLVLALIAGGVALVQRQSAQRSARQALARQLGAEAVSVPRIDQAMLLAREGVLLDKTSDTAGTLLATLLRSPTLQGTMTMPIQVRPQRVALGADGSKLAVVGNDGKVYFFDTKTRRLTDNHAYGDWGGAGLWTVGSDFAFDRYDPKANSYTIEVVDAKTLQHRKTLQFSKLFLNTPTTSPACVSSTDGSRFTCGYAETSPDRSQDKQSYLESWDLRSSSHRLRKVPGRGMDVVGALPDGQVVAATDNAIVTVDGASLATKRRLAVHLGQGTGTVSPDGSTIAWQAGGPTDEVSSTYSLLDVATGRLTATPAAHVAGIQAMGFDPSSHYLVTTGDDARVVVSDAHTGAVVDTLTGHSGRVLGLAFSSDGKTLYTCALDGAIFVWDLGSGARFGRLVHVGALDGLPGAPAMALSPDGGRFAARVGPGRVRLYSVRTLRAVGTFTVGGGDVHALAWSRRGVLAVGETEGGVQLWSTGATPSRLRALSQGAGDVTDLAFSPDGEKLAVTTEVEPKDPASNAPATGGVGIWDAATGRSVSVRPLKDPGSAVAWSHDGRTLALASGQGQLQVMDVEGHVRRTFGHLYDDTITDVAFLADGDLLAGGYNGIVVRWDPRTGKRVGHPVLTEPAPVSSIAVSPDGERFAVSGGSSGGLKIWDAATLQQFGATFPGGAGTWGNVAYTPDGANVVVAYGDGTAAVWPASVAAWMQHACAVAGRNFTHEEWSRFVTGHAYAKTCPGYPAA